MCNLLFILFTSEMFELDENRLHAYADNSTLLTVVHKRADRPAVAASIDMDFDRRNCAITWYMILNPNKTKALVVSIWNDILPPLE